MRHVTVFITLMGLMLWVACQPSRSRTENRIAAMEERLFTAEAGFSRPGADSLIGLYREYAINWPDDSLAPVFLFKAATLTMNLHDGQGALALFAEIGETYPGFEKAPLCLFFTGYVQENILGDLDQARVTYQQFIDTYPGHEFADDAQASIENLGKTPEQMIAEFEARQAAGMK